MEKRKLSFSIQGEFITRLAKEWFFIEHRPYEQVEELLLSCMQGSNETLAQLKNRVQDILLGKAEFQGNSDDGSFCLVYLDKDLNNDNIFIEYGKIAQKNKKLKEDFDEINKKYLDLIDCLEDWKNSFLDVSTLSDTYVKQILLDIDNGYRVTRVKKNELPKEEKTNKYFSPPGTGNDLLDSYLKASHYDVKYGWVDPNGNFYEVEWGNHQIWPYYSIMEFERIIKGEYNEYNAVDLSKYREEYIKWCNEESYRNEINDGAEFLIEVKGWVLIHSPSNGIPIISQSDIKRLTKAQKDFLFDYYTKLNEPKKASEIYDE